MEPVSTRAESISENDKVGNKKISFYFPFLYAVQSVADLNRL